MTQFKCLLTLVLIGLLGSQVVAQESNTQELCPQINCDCSNLPEASWVSACESHQQLIKKRCAINNNTPTDFCSIHGPAATPLPLTVHLDEVKILPEAEITATHKKAATMYWAAHTDLKTLKIKVGNLQVREALNLLKIMDHNLDGMFAQQRQVTLSWWVYENSDEAVESWSMYAEDSLKMAENFYSYAQEISEQLPNMQNPAASSAYRVIAMRLYRLAGKAYEVAGYAYAGAGDHRGAAQAWVKGSTVSRAVMLAKTNSGAELTHINFYQHQAASRLHRASYHWMMASDPEKAKSSLTESQQFVPEENSLSKLFEVQESSAENALLAP